MRTARIVGDEAVALIIEPEELSIVRAYLGAVTPGVNGVVKLPGGTTVASALYEHIVRLMGGHQDQLLYENTADLPASVDSGPPIEVNWG